MRARALPPQVCPLRDLAFDLPRAVGPREGSVPRGHLGSRQGKGNTGSHQGSTPNDGECDSWCVSVYPTHASSTSARELRENQHVPSTYSRRADELATGKLVHGNTRPPVPCMRRRISSSVNSWA
jgi:hypothetical protein